MSFAGWLLESAAGRSIVADELAEAERRYERARARSVEAGPLDRHAEWEMEDAGLYVLRLRDELRSARG